MNGVKTQDTKCCYLFLTDLEQTDFNVTAYGQRNFTGFLDLSSLKSIPGAHVHFIFKQRQSNFNKPTAGSCHSSPSV